MKKTIVTAVCVAALMATAATAGSLSDPVVTAEVVSADAQATSNENMQIILGWIALIGIFGLGVAGF